MDDKNVFNERATFGLKANLAGLLCYAGVFISGFIFLVLERDNKFVRFHALQSTILFGILSVLKMAISIFPILGGLAASIISFVSFACWVLLMLTAYSGKVVKIPVFGDVAWAQVNK